MFSTWSFVSHARRACAIPISIQSSALIWCASVSTGIFETCLPRAARVDVAQVEAVGLRVHLEERPRLEPLLDHTLDVDVGRRRAC